MSSSEKNLISATIRDLLIEHIDGPVKLNVIAGGTLGDQRKRSLRNQNLRNAMKWGMIDLIDQRTVMTEKGREALCKMLGYWADVLARAGFEFTAAPIMKDRLAEALIDSDSHRK